MLESFIGTICLCIIIITFALSFIQFIGTLIGTKTFEPEVLYIGDYVQSIIIFLFISTLVLLLYVHIYFINSVDSALYNSGLLFIFYSAIASIVIDVLYTSIMKIILYFSKSKTTYFLKEDEKNWTWIFIMVAYTIYFGINNLFLYSYSYIALILSYLFWMHPTKSSLTEKITQLKSLSLSYWCCFVFIIICGFAAVRYSEPLYTIASVIGIISGFPLGIFFMTLISKRMKH